MLAHQAGKLRFAADLSRADSIGDLTRRLYEGIDVVFGSVAVGFDLLDPHTHRPQSSSGQGVSSFFLAKYDRVAREADPVLRHAIVSRDLAYNLAMMSEREWRDLRVYREVFSLHRMMGIVYAPVVVDDKVIATLNLARAEHVASFSTEELRDAVELADLIGSLLASLWRREDLEHQLRLYRDTLDLSNEAVVISDVVRAARYTNAAARRVLDEQSGDGLSFDEALIESQSSARRQDAGEGLIERSVALGRGETFVAFLRCRPRADALPAWLRNSLTEREADVVLLVARGLRDAEIATTLTLSVHTVKSYLREVFKKTGTRSRLELARLALGSGA